jgi:hypothetical protein
MRRTAWVLVACALAALAVAKPGPGAKARASKGRSPALRATPSPTPLPTPTPLPEDRPGAALPDAALQARAQALDGAVTRVLAQDRYTWRSDRAARQAMGENLALVTLRQALAKLGRWIERGLRWVGKSVRGFWDWLEERLRGVRGGDKDRKKRGAVDLPDEGPLELWAGLILVALAASALALFIYRRARQLPAPVLATAVAVPGDLDLAQPELRGDELPEDGWLALAARLAAEGQGRLALRAYYLAALAALGRAGLLRLAASRSVGEYRRQLQRGGAASALRERFKAFSARYEHAWFGTRSVGPDDLAQAAQDQEALRGAAL